MARTLLIISTFLVSFALTATAGAESCKSENISNCSDLQICINATPKRTSWIKRRWAGTEWSKPYVTEAKRRNLGCNVGGLQKTPLTNENIRKIGKKNPTFEFATDWEGLKGRWDGSIQCRGRKFDLTFQVNGASAELQTAKYVYKGKVTYSADRRKAFVKASRDDGKKFNEIFELSKDFTSVSGVTSAGCEFSASNPKPIALGNKPVTQKKETYLEKCRLTSDRLKDAQRLLKQLGLYPYKIDGIAGKGTLAGIKKAKKLVGSAASKGDCISASDIKAFQTLAANTLCTKDKLDQCSDRLLCERATERSNLLVSWMDNEYAAQAKSLGLDCNVTLVCSSRNIEVCTDEAVCEKATILRSGVRSWNFEEDAFIDRAKNLGLDCKLTIDNTPFSKKEAVYYLSQLVDFVTENAGDFDLNFASEFDNVRPITQGEWSTALSKDFELFRVYIAKFPSFQKHLEELRLANDAANQKRIEQLRSAISQYMVVLKEWAKANVLDAKAAEIASLDANVGNKSLQDVNSLEQLVAEAQRLMSATGIVDGPVQQVTQEVVDSLYDPSSVYLFVNTSGNAENIYKNLEGAFTFEQNSGTYCPTEKLGAFDYYLLRDRLFETFEGLSSVEQDCSQATDIFVVKGNELTTDRVFDVIPLSSLTQVSEFSKADRDKAYDQLTFLKETIQKDVLDGTRVGFGILKTDRTASKVCAIIDGDEYGHQEQLGQHRLLMNALNLQWDGFEKVTSNSEEAFKFLQRGQCDAIYAGSLNLGRLYLAGDIAGVSLDFLPIWISKASVEASQQAYDDNVAASAQANAEAEQNLEDQAKLDEQAKQSAAELAAVRQRELREQNGLRFMVLRDELQDQVFAASEFGFENSSEEAGYIKRYLTQPFVDQTTRYSPFDGIISDMQTLAAERWEITEQRLDQMDYGEASFNGRSVDALQVELKIASKNRLVGKYSEYCRRIHAIKDEDFEMWRNISVTDCSNEAATSQWKLENAFQSKWIVEPN